MEVPRQKLRRRSQHPVSRVLAAGRENFEEEAGERGERVRKTGRGGNNESGGGGARMPGRSWDEREREKDREEPRAKSLGVR